MSQKGAQNKKTGKKTLFLRLLYRACFDTMQLA